MKKNKISLAVTQARTANRKTLVTYASTAALLLCSNFALAQQAEPEQTEVIEVTGVRSSLENALNVKREATSIVDAISATDIDALPALDLGEALQALPGIQLNSGDEGRQSTISLRGLSSGFVKTTAFGQSFATPSAAGNIQVGAANPFSAFEAGIFDGVTVVKSPTADLQEGGMAGTVDKKLQQALSKKDGTASIGIGVNFEELADAYNPELKLSGVKHLIEDKLAVAFKYSSSGQEFRRDTFDVVDYVSVETDNNGARATNIDEYRANWNVPTDAQLRVPLRGRNVHQYSKGDRASFSGNIEYRITDDFKVGAHILLSERQLDNGTKETTNYEIGLHRTNSRNDYLNGEVTLDLATAPFAYTPLTQDGQGAQAYIVSNLDFQNGKLQIENRKTTFNEKSQGLMLYADYIADDWVFDGVVTLSKAQNNFENIGLNFVHEGNRSGAQTGFNGSLNTGQGDANNIVVTGQLDVPYVYDGLTTWTSPTASSSNVLAIDPLNQGRRLRANINGRVRDLDKDYNSVAFNATRYTDFAVGESFRVESVKFGAHVSEETLVNLDQLQGFGGVDTANISGAYLSTDAVLSASQAPFFNGKIPGTFDHTNGWVTIVNDQAINALQTNIVTERNDLLLPNGVDEIYPSLMRNRSGFWDRITNRGIPNQVGENFSADQLITAVYVTANFAGELPLDISYTGNIGVRHIETDNTFDGAEIVEGADGKFSVAAKTFKDDYTNTLPMMNISFELTEDLVLRTAYYEGIVRPNLVSQTPSASVNPGNSTVRLSLPRATVRPYEADNYDVSLEWYNREGSAISIGYFQKNITNLFDQLDGYCPEGGVDPLVDQLIGAVERVDISEVEFTCQEVAEYQQIDGEFINREVIINTPINNDDELKVEGYELAIQQKLDFLPYPWNGFGGVFNYTKLRQSGSEGQLTRVSPQSYNLIAYWENNGVSLRFAYNWRDEQNLQGANSFLGTGVRTRTGRGRLDFSGSYAFNKNVKAFFQAFNLTDVVGKEYYGYDERAIHSLAYEGRVYKASISYKF